MIKQNKFGFNVKLPYHVLRFHNEELNSLKAKKSNRLRQLRDLRGNKDFYNRAVSNVKQEFDKKIKHLKEKESAYIDFLRIKAINYDLPFMANKLFIPYLQEKLDITRQHADRLKRKLIKHGFARIRGNSIYFTGNNDTWEMFGFKTKRNKIVDDKKQRINSGGVFYESADYKKEIIVDGKSITKTFVRTQKVPLVKFEASIEQIRSIPEFKKAIIIAYLKQYENNEESCKDPDRHKDEDGGFKLSCSWFAEKLGYSSLKSGWNIREELKHSGFINVGKKIVEIDVKDYNEAKEKYELQKGIQEDGYAYRFNKEDGKVHAVKCYTVKLNGYTPVKIIHKYRRKYKKKVKKVEQKTVNKYHHVVDNVKFYASYLELLSGKTFDFIYRKYYELFQDFDCPYLDYLYHIQETGEEFNINKAERFSEN